MPKLATVVGSVIGAVAGLLVTAVLLLPLSQCLIDYYDDNVVLWTIRYFKWAVIAFCVLCCVAGATIGRVVARGSACDDSTKGSLHG